MKINRKFDKVEITVDVTREEIVNYLSSLPLKERTELVKGLFEKDKTKLVTNIKENISILRDILDI